MKLVGFGYSHIQSIHLASVTIIKSEPDIVVKTIMLHDPSLPQIFSTAEYGNVKFSYGFSKHIDNISKDADVVFLCVGSNAHQIFSLVNHKIPYDFVLPCQPDLPLHPKYETIPSKLVQEAICNQGGFPESIRMLRAFKKFFKDKEIVQCALPPVIPSAAHIEKYSGPFHEQINITGISPKIIRYKHWKLHSQLLEEECNNLGIQIIPVPASMIDKHGFLNKLAWNPDATHANEYYGAKVIEQLIRLKNPQYSLLVAK